MTERSHGNSTPTTRLPPDVIGRIFSYLPYASNVACCASVCASWRDAVAHVDRVSFDDACDGCFAVLPRARKERAFLHMVRQMVSLRELLIDCKDHSSHPWLHQAALIAALHGRQATLRSLTVNGATHLAIPFQLAVAEAPRRRSARVKALRGVAPAASPGGGGAGPLSLVDICLRKVVNPMEAVVCGATLRSLELHGFKASRCQLAAVLGRACPHLERLTLTMGVAPPGVYECDAPSLRVLRVRGLATANADPSAVAGELSLAVRAEKLVSLDYILAGGRLVVEAAAGRQLADLRLDAVRTGSVELQGPFPALKRLVVQGNRGDLLDHVLCQVAASGSSVRYFRCRAAAILSGPGQGTVLARIGAALRSLHWLNVCGTEIGRLDCSPPFPDLLGLQLDFVYGMNVEELGGLLTSCPELQRLVVHFVGNRSNWGPSEALKQKKEELCRDRPGLQIEVIGC